MIKIVYITEVWFCFFHSWEKHACYIFWCFGTYKNVSCYCASWMISWLGLEFCVPNLFLSDLNRYHSILYWDLIFESILHFIVPGGASDKEPACQCRKHRRPGFNSWVRKIPGEGNGNPLQYSCLEDPMDKGAWWATIHGFTKSWTQLSRCTHVRIHTHTHTW